VRLIVLPLLLSLALVPAADPPSKPEPGSLSAATFAGLKLRSLGPAVTSGRVVGFAVHPTNPDHYYVAVASGGVWKTINGGTSWTPVFDNEGSYSIGYVTLDPKNPSVVWVGTGENNSQRSVGYGDGVYKSVDGGKTWTRMKAMQASEHIGRIILDPRDSNTVYVAAQGPLWNAGGDRGLYKTTDGGATWNKVLNISENTGVTDVILDPRNPDVLIAASYQRRRHVWTLIDGGPESAIHKSTDGGKSWRKLAGGLPTGDLGRIGLAVAPSNPDVVYAIVESTDKKGGIFRSADRGETWERRNDFDQQAQYYAHIVVDPRDENRVYVMNVLIRVSDDGAKTLRPLGEKWKHVDNHTIWIDPRNPSHYRVGCDGGIYESRDRAANWQFLANLPVTQFYDVAVSDDGPWYHVYGGTQDNNTLGGPAKSKSIHGIMNQDWDVVQGGDGFQCRVDPKDPNTVYAELQYGVLCRYDRRTGQRLGIQPQPGPGEMLRWNWDSPLVVSPHAHTRIYFAANKVFRSDDRGDAWKAISGDLTRQIDRNKLPVMGKVWPADAVSKSVSTSFYGNCTALAESPLKEGLLYAGTDDGLIQAKEGDADWRRIDKFPFVPEMTYVSRILPSQHAEQTVYASFDNHKMGDFRPYLLKSTDAGRSWTSVSGDLPERGSVLAIAEDHKDPELLFVGTEFGLYFTLDGGKKWVRLKGGTPTIAVRDLAIQKGENDLVVATFGRGFYVLDDYSLLRGLKPDTLQKVANLFPVKDALLYMPTRQYGLRSKAFLGEAFYTAENAPFGATFTYHLKEEIKTKKQLRLAAEKKAETAPYPSREELRAEAEEESPAVLLTISDAEGHEVRTVTGPVTAGFHRVTWDLRDPAATLPRQRPGDAEDDIFLPPPGGPLVMPGRYTVTLAQRVGGKTQKLADPVEFNILPEGATSMDVAALKELREFQVHVWKLQRAVSGALDAANELSNRLQSVQRALDQTPGARPEWQAQVRDMEKRNREVLRALRGDVALQARNENTPASISERVAYAVDASRLSLARPTATEREAYRIANEEFGEALPKLRRIVREELPALEKAMEAAGAPWTPGRLPEWKDK
jgi:photosystem II stability/assembly factor-like uncharacterized protein